MAGPESLDELVWKDLSERQRNALPVVLSGATLKSGLETAEVSTSTWYRWRSEPGFEKAFRFYQRMLVQEALTDLKGGVRYAVAGLMGLMTSKNEHIRLQACRDVLANAIRALEVGELGERVEGLEMMLKPLLDEVKR
jgi:hypothetical protein